MDERGDERAAIRELLARGELLDAFDHAHEYAAARPDDIAAPYFMALALARAGATDRAERVLGEYDLVERARGAGAPWDEDVPALAARCAKDRALGAGPDRRGPLLAEAANAYERVWQGSGAPYAGVNASTLWVLAGRPDHAAQLARSVLAVLDTAESRDRASAGDARDAYWWDASRAEAALAIGAVDDAAGAIEDAARSSAGLYAARATTRRQLQLLCAALGVDSGILDPLANPITLHYTGHLASAGDRQGGLRAEDEAPVCAEVARIVSTQQIGFGYGSLACGADILCAEALLDAGAELHVLLPLPRDEFVRVSVLPGGERWGARFTRCVDAATSVSTATDDPFLDDEALFDYSARVAMGRAITRARYLATDAQQIAVFDGYDNHSGFGTAADIARWHARGLHTNVVSIPDRRAPRTSDSSPRPPKPIPRAVRAVLFGDVKGFSRLSDSTLPTFVDGVIGALARAADKHSDAILHRNRWGDAVHLVFTDVVSAANCALDLQEAIDGLDYPALGLPDDLQLRIGIHAGPVFEGTDPLCHEPAYFGAALTRAARIEPATPPGDVYVTEPFAAILALEGPPNLQTQYVGRITTAKGYGELPLSLLRRRVD